MIVLLPRPGREPLGQRAKPVLACAFLGKVVSTVSAYSPDQPRDAHGRFGSGGLDLPAGLKRGEAKQQSDHPSWKAHEDWKRQSYGGVLVNENGKFLLREPSNHFDGYHWTFPKGGLDHPEEHPVDVALREVAEETGRKGRVIEPLPGNYRGGTGGNTNFYVMRSYGNHPELMDDETRSTRWATYQQAKQLISRSTNPAGRARDLAILDRAQAHVQKYAKKIEAFSPEQPCDESGKWTVGSIGDAKAILLKKGFTHIGKTVVPGKEHLKYGNKSTYVHPTAGKVWLDIKSTDPFYHQAPGGGVTKNALGSLPGILPGSKSIAPSEPAIAPVTAPAVSATPDTAFVVSKDYTGTSFGYPGEKIVWDRKTSSFVGLQTGEQYSALKVELGLKQGHLDVAESDKKTGPPSGLPEAIKGPKGGVYTWHEGNQAYTHKYNPEYQIAPNKAADLLKKGTYSSVGKTTSTTLPTKDVGVTTSPQERQKETANPEPLSSSPAVSTTVIPGSMRLTPEQFSFKDSGKGLGGAHDKYVFADKNGNDWLFKPATTLGGQTSPVMAHADEMASRIAQAVRPGYAIEATTITMPVPFR